MTVWRLMKSWGAVLALPVVVACGTSEADEAPTVQSAVVERGDLAITAEATGNVEPVRKVEVKSKASGEILQMHVDIGDEVEPGALLARIDPRDVRNAGEQAEADLEVAQARLDIARAQLTRSAGLLESGVISVQEHESKNLEFANAQATLVKAKTNHELAQLRLEDVTIRAPMAGTILEKNVEEGQVIQSASQNVSGGTVLLVMANLEQMQVRTLVDETDMGEIRAGMRATVTVEAYPDRPFIGEVEKIEPQAVVQQNVTMFPVIVRLDNRSGLLKPGMNAEVEVSVAEAPSVLLIPNAAVVTPQEAVAAALVLGLSEDAVDVRSMFAGMGGGRGSGGGLVGQGGGRRAGGQGVTPERGGGATQPGAARETPGQSGGGGAGAVVGAGRLPGDPAEGGSGAAVESRRAVVFVMAPSGTIEPRAVMIGLNDWDFTQVVVGLEEGEQVALIGAAQLRASQDAFLERIRSRSSPFGGGGPGSGGGRGPR